MSREDDRREMIDKLKALSKKRYGSEDAWDKLFLDYDKDHDGQATRAELEKLLEDADIGNRFSRGHWVTGLILELDRDLDGKASKKEVEDRLAFGKPIPRFPKGRTITDEEARKWAVHILASPAGTVDVSTLSDDDLTAIEKIMDEISPRLPVQTPVPKPPLIDQTTPPNYQPKPPKPPQEKPKEKPKEAQNDAKADQILTGVLVGLFVFVLTRRWR